MKKTYYSLLIALTLVVGCQHTTTGGTELAKAQAWFTSVEEIAVEYLSFVADNKHELGSDAIEVGQRIQTAMADDLFVDAWMALNLWNETRHIDDKAEFTKHKRDIIKLLHNAEQHMDKL